MATAGTPVQLGGASGSRASLSGADAVILRQLGVRKDASGAAARGAGARSAAGGADEQAHAVATVLQCPALLALLFSFLEPGDLCTVALVCDAWSLVRHCPTRLIRPPVSQRAGGSCVSTATDVFEGQTFVSTSTRQSGWWYLFYIPA